MRLFLAIDLPPEVRQTLRDTQTRLADRLPGWRWLAPEAIHLTVRFLGEVAEPDHRSQLPAWRQVAAAGQRIELELDRLGVFPSARRPRVLWVGVEERARAGALLALAQGVERAAREQGFAPEPRGFRPHLTIARARHAMAARAPDPEAKPPVAVFEALELTLFRSRLRPSGAEYTRLESFPLGG